MISSFTTSSRHPSLRSYTNRISIALISSELSSDWKSSSIVIVLTSKLFEIAFHYILTGYPWKNPKTKNELNWIFYYIHFIRRVCFYPASLPVLLHLSQQLFWATNGFGFTDRRADRKAVEAAASFNYASFQTGPEWLAHLREGPLCFWILR